MSLINELERMRIFYASGATRSYNFRKEQLLKLKKALLKYEHEIYAALYTDLKKSKEESYSTEIGVISGEINIMLKNLKQWMQPESVTTELVNLPSSSKIYRDSLGMVLIIAPWNYPFQLSILPLAGAIAGGNCVVLKPSELAPATSAIIQKIVSEIFPKEYINVVEGDGATVVPEMMNNFQFNHVLYTGSIPVGKIIYKMAAEKLVPVTLELGGKSPAIVEADADIAATANRIVLGKFVNAGQTCIAPDYLLVHADIKEKLLERIKSTIEKFYTSDSANSDEYGKIINESRFDKLVSYLIQGKIIYGGQYDRGKLHIAPTLIDNVSVDSALMKEEIFGPILPVLTFNTTEEAMKIVQLNANPLSLYLFTKNGKTQREWIEKIPFGGGCINNSVWHFANKSFPFGGVGNSGIGAYHGRYSFNLFTREKPVLKTPTWLDPSMKYPPFKGKMKLFKWVIK